VLGVLTALALLSPSPLFDLLCTPCHGPAGRGDGPAAALWWPRPADLSGPLKLGGSRTDLRRTLLRGVPGTGMPAFGSLAPADLDALVGEVLEIRQKIEPEFEPILEAPGERSPGAHLWTGLGCSTCHGVNGAGSALRLTDHRGLPADLYDLRTAPLKGGERPVDLFVSLTRGRPGTPMPALGTLAVADRWALVAFIEQLRRGQRVDTYGRVAPPGVPPGAPDPFWSGPEVGAPPGDGPPILQTGDADQCGRCHPAVQAAWAQSRHAQAWGPGLQGQAVGRSPAWAQRCAQCHAPTGAPAAGQPGVGVSCAACHLRGGHKVGRGVRSDARMPPGLRAQVEPRMGRSDFCMPCHTLPPGPTGMPLLDTWREWAASPYLPAGIQCQHCHVPDGDHHFAGAHDPVAVRRAVRLTAEVEGVAELTVVARVENVGAGHHFPTTATPRAVLRIRQRARGAVLPHTEHTWALGRTARLDPGGWNLIADTRVPAGQSRWVTYRAPRSPGADEVEVDLSFFPDWYYSTIFRAALAGRPHVEAVPGPARPPTADEALADALEAATHSAFPVVSVRLPLQVK